MPLVAARGTEQVLGMRLARWAREREEGRDYVVTVSEGGFGNRLMGWIGQVCLGHGKSV